MDGNAPHQSKKRLNKNSSYLSTSYFFDHLLVICNTGGGEVWASSDLVEFWKRKRPQPREGEAVLIALCRRPPLQAGDG